VLEKEEFEIPPRAVKGTGDSEGVRADGSGRLVEDLSA